MYEKSNSFNRAQGTIEYLVIIAIVVVIALVVVSILTGFLGTGSDVGDKSTKISNMSNLLAINDTIAGEDGNGLIVLKNNDSETITINKIVVDGVDHNFSDADGTLPFGSEKSFKVEDIATCDSTKKSYTIKIYYTSKNGLSKTADFSTMTIDCTPVVTPSGNFVEETSSEPGEVDYSCDDPTDDSCWSTVAPSTMTWGPNPSTPGVSTDDTANNGESNQQQVIDNHWDGNPYDTPSNYPAFAYCEQLEDGYPAGTWYLPSVNQLKDGLTAQFVTSPATVAGFTDGTPYWSSTEISSSNAWIAGYDGGSVLTDSFSKDSTFSSVRCLR